MSIIPTEGVLMVFVLFIFHFYISILGCSSTLRLRLSTRRERKKERF